MKRALSVGSSLVVALLAFSPALAQLTEAPRLLNSALYDPSIKGSITVGSSIEEVRQAFGRLNDEGDGSFFAIDWESVASEGMAKTLRYPGFTVTLEQDPTTSEYAVFSISLRSPDFWVTPGLTVKMVTPALTALLGKPELVAVDGNSGDRILHYSFTSPPGDLRIQLSHGMVRLIELHRDLRHAG